MPQATTTPTTPETRAPDCTASQDAMMRMLAPSFISGDDWNSRSPTNRAMMAVQGAAERLEGLRNICFEVSFAETAKGHSNGGMGSPYRFLAVTLGDLAGALSAAHKLWWDDYNVEAESEGDVAEAGEEAAAHEAEIAELKAELAACQASHAPRGSLDDIEGEAGGRGMTTASRPVAEGCFPPSACVREDPLPNPAPPPASDPAIIIALASAVALSQCEQAALIDDLSRRRVRTLDEAVAVSRLALNLPQAEAHPLFVRLARYVLAQPKPSAGVGQ